MSEYKVILKVLVGSRAHGLANPDSDSDYRGVFVAKTSDMLKLGGSTKSTQWIEAKDDDTSYEIGHFLHLATKSNPSILEVFASPVMESTPEGIALRDLFPYVWSKKRVLDAFVGYSRNQQKKMMDDKYESRERKWKYAVAYVRVLLQAQSLLATGMMPVKIPDKWIEELREIKAGRWTVGMIVDLVDRLKVGLFDIYEKTPDKEMDQGPINAYLLALRKANW